MENYLVKNLPKTDLLKLVGFVVDQNRIHHKEPINSLERDRRVAQMLVDEIRIFEHSCHYYAENFYTKDFIGCIRLLKWNRISALPIQTEFGVDAVSLLIGKPEFKVYHIGRFAIARGIRSLMVFKSLMLAAIAPICAEEPSVAFAECDEKLLTILNLLGIEARVIGKPKLNLGSVTYPISMSQMTLKKFYDRNKTFEAASYNIPSQSLS